MLKTRSLRFTGIAAVAVLCTLTACSSDSSGASEPGSDVELRMTLWTSDPNQLAVLQSIADDFMAQEPAVTAIKFDSLTLDQLDTVLTSDIQAGTPPDLTWLPVESSAQYIQAGALADVAPTLKETKGYDYEDLIPSLQERWQDGDALYGVPFSTGPLVMFYNKDLYAKAGVKSPEDLIAEDNWTWESFRDISKQLHDKLDMTGYVVNDFDYKNWTRLLPTLYAYGAEPWDESATQCTANSPEFAQAIQVFHDMVFTDESSPVPGQQADFWGGQAGATTAFLSSNTLLEDAPFDFGIVPTPSGPAGDTQALGQAAITVLAAGQHQQLAMDFLAFLTNRENTAKLAQFWPPIRSSLLDAKTIADTSDLLTPKLVAPIVDATKSTGKVFPVAADASGVANALNGALDQYVWTRDANVPEALNSVCDAVQPLLN